MAKELIKHGVIKASDLLKICKATWSAIDADTKIMEATTPYVHFPGHGAVIVDNELTLPGVVEGGFLAGYFVISDQPTLIVIMPFMLNHETQNIERIKVDR